MKKLLALEEFGQSSAALFCLYTLQLSTPWVLWLLLFFSPDAGALGYLINRKVGAFFYNLLHHKLTALGLIALGFFINQKIVVALGLLWYGHSSFDRILGYGLKYMDNPNRTHLGFIGKEKFRNEE